MPVTYRIDVRGGESVKVSISESINSIWSWRHISIAKRRGKECMLLIRVVARHIDIRLIINFQLLKPRRVKGCGILNIQINNRLVITRRILALATVLAGNDYSF